MKIKTGNYVKDDGSKRQVQLLILNESEKDLHGIDLTKLNDLERGVLQEIISKYEEGIKPYIKKAFRHLKKDNFEKEGT